MSVPDCTNMSDFFVLGIPHGAAGARAAPAAHAPRSARRCTLHACFSSTLSVTLVNAAPNLRMRACAQGAHVRVRACAQGARPARCARHRRRVGTYHCGKAGGSEYSSAWADDGGEANPVRNDTFVCGIRPVPHSRFRTSICSFATPTG